VAATSGLLASATQCAPQSIRKFIVAGDKNARAEIIRIRV